jgi:HD domain
MSGRQEDSAGRRVRVFRMIAAGAWMLAMVVGATALLGWVLGLESLKAVVPGHVAMKANTAVSLVVLGGALGALRREGPSRLRRPAAVTVTLVGALALVTWSQYIHGRDLGIDQLLFREAAGAVGTSDPGRMAPNTALTFVLLAAALLTLDTHLARRWWPAPALSSLAGMLALLALLGYASGVTSLYGLSRLTQMAVPTAIAILALSVGIACARPTRGMMHLFVAETAGGAVARRLVPAAIGVPLILGALRLAGQDAGLYDPSVGGWLFAIALIALLVPLILVLACALDRLDADRGEALAMSAAERRARELLQDAQVVMLERLALAAEYRDDETGEHTRRVGALSARIATALGCPEDFVALVRQVAPLHDVGKIGVPDSILLKPGSLTPRERELVNAHTVVGARVLQRQGYELLELAADVALSHHERWDGTGYPLGRAGEGIPVAGRIIAVADVFDALTHHRPYKPAWPVAEAVAEIRDQRGRQFDPRVVDAFIDVLADDPDLRADYQRSGRFMRRAESLADTAHGASG